MTELFVYVWDRDWAGCTVVVARDEASAKILLRQQGGYHTYTDEVLQCYPLVEGLVLDQLGDT